MLPGYTKLGSGTFNNVYISEDRRTVLKVQRYRDATDTPERSVRLWNAINPTLEKAQVVQINDALWGWTCPFVEGVQASQSEISMALVDIYNRTGRIIVDAIAPNNFVKTTDDKIVCIDIGMALQMEPREEAFLSSTTRSKSIISNHTWNETIREDYKKWFTKYEIANAIQTVKALLFIKKTRPDMVDVTCLENDRLLEQLARAYDSTDNKTIRTTLNSLDDVAAVYVALAASKPKPTQANIDERALRLHEVKNNCVAVLEAYINSRGSRNKTTGEISLSAMSSLFRNMKLTAAKIREAHDLLIRIQGAESIQEIDSALNEKVSDKLFASAHTSKFEEAIGKCLDIVAPFRDNPEDTPPSQITLS